MNKFRAFMPATLFVLVTLISGKLFAQATPAVPDERHMIELSDGAGDFIVQASLGSQKTLVRLGVVSISGVNHTAYIDFVDLNSIYSCKSFNYKAPGFLTPSTALYNCQYLGGRDLLPNTYVNGNNVYRYYTYTEPWTRDDFFGFHSITDTILRFDNNTDVVNLSGGGWYCQRQPFCSFSFDWSRYTARVYSRDGSRIKNSSSQYFYPEHMGGSYFLFYDGTPSSGLVYPKFETTRYRIKSGSALYYPKDKSFAYKSGSNYIVNQYFEDSSSHIAMDIRSGGTSSFSYKNVNAGWGEPSSISVGSMSSSSGTLYYPGTGQDPIKRKYNISDGFVFWEGGVGETNAAETCHVISDVEKMQVFADRNSDVVIYWGENFIEDSEGAYRLRFASFHATGRDYTPETTLPPRNLRITGATPRSINVSWTPPATLPSNYRVMIAPVAQFSVDQLLECGSGSYVDRNESSYEFNSLSPDTDYSIALCAQGSAGISEIQRIGTRTPQEFPPQLPRNLSFSDWRYSPSSGKWNALLSWDPQMFTPGASNIRYFYLGVNGECDADDRRVFSSSYRVQNISAGSNGYVRICSVGDFDLQSASVHRSMSPPAIPTPQTPNNLRLEDWSYNSGTNRWSANFRWDPIYGSGAASRIHYFRVAQNSTCSVTNGSRVDGNVYSVGNVTSGSSGTISVCAVGEFNLLSGPVSISLTPPAGPLAPGSISFSNWQFDAASGKYSVSASWLPSVGTGDIAYFRVSPTGSCSASQGTRVNSNNYTLSGITPSSTGSFSVCSVSESPTAFNGPVSAPYTAPVAPRPPQVSSTSVNDWSYDVVNHRFAFSASWQPSPSASPLISFYRYRFNATCTATVGSSTTLTSVNGWADVNGSSYLTICSIGPDGQSSAAKRVELDPPAIPEPSSFANYSFDGSDLSFSGEAGYQARVAIRQASSMTEAFPSSCPSQNSTILSSSGIHDLAQLVLDTGAILDFDRNYQLLICQRNPHTGVESSAVGARFATAVELSATLASLNPDGNFEVSFKALPGRSYQVKGSNDLSIFNDDVGSVLRATSFEETISFVDSSTSNRRFYKVYQLP